MIAGLRPRDALLAALAALLSAMPVLVPALRGHLPGHPVSDLADHVQGAWWWGGEVLAGRFPWRVEGILWPSGGVLWYPDPIGAALALPFRGLGPFGSYSAALAVQCAANALAGWWLGRKVAGPEAGFFTACVTGPSAYAAAAVHGGVTEYVGIWPIALFVGGALDYLFAAAAPSVPPSGDPSAPRSSSVAGAFVQRGRRPWLPAVAMGLATLQSFYFGAFCGVLGVCLAAGAVEMPLRVRAARGLQILAAGTLLSAPTLLIAWASLSHPEAVVDRALAPGWSQPAPPGTDLLLFLWPADRYHPDTPALGNPGILHVHHLGWIALLLAIAAWRDPSARAWRWGALLWFVLALGPSLVVAGEPIRILGVSVPLPGRLLWFPGSPFALVHHPYRMVAATLPLLGLLGALTVRRLPTPARVAAGLLVVAEAWWVSPAPFPWVGTDPSPPASYADLPPGAVLDLPADLRAPNRRYVLWALTHGHPVPYGVNAWVSLPLREDPQVRELLLPFADRAHRTNRDVPPRDEPFPDPRDHGGLAGLGITAVVFHPDLAGDDAERALERLRARLGEPDLRDGRWVWRVDTATQER